MVEPHGTTTKYDEICGFRSIRRLQQALQQQPHLPHLGELVDVRHREHVDAQRPVVADLVAIG